MLNLNSYTSKIDEGKSGFFLISDLMMEQLGIQVSLGPIVWSAFWMSMITCLLKGTFLEIFVMFFPSIFLPITLLKSLFKGKGI